MTNCDKNFQIKVIFYIFSLFLFLFCIQSKPPQLVFNQQSINNLQNQIDNQELFPTQRLHSFDVNAHGLSNKASIVQNIQNGVTQQSQKKMLITENQSFTNSSSTQDLQNESKKPLKRKPRNFYLEKHRYRKVDLKTNLNKPYVYKPPTTPPLSPEVIKQREIQDQKSAIENHKITDKMLKQVDEWRKMVILEVDEITRSVIQQYEYYQQKYNISKYEELPFCIVVPTFNNKQKGRYLMNIQSIVMQNYSNYHVVVIDDASDDGTGDLISEYLDKQTILSKQRYQFIKNEEQKRAMYNLRISAMEYCGEQEIFLVVDGDDQLLGRQVLKVFNAYFQRYDAWFVYSNFIHGLINGLGYSRPFPKVVKQQNRYRSYPFITSHLRAFYTKLFRNIQDKDLRDAKGNYFKAANDVAICIPVLQQAHQHVMYLPEITYFYNDNTGLNNHLIRGRQQRENDQYVRTKANYKPLKKLFDEN